MKKPVKWIIIGICAAVMMLCLSCASADTDGTWGDLTWTLEDGVLTISGAGRIEAFSYTSTDAWRTYKEQITSVIIENNVTSIGVSAFSGCTNLASITIPESVMSIQHWAFNNCCSLTSITIPDSVTSIQRWAFRNCSSLKSITIPDGVTSIGEETFFGCSSLESITIPDSVREIGNSAFYNCSSLKSITIPYGVTNVGNCVFYNCSSLTYLRIPDGVTSIGDHAFHNCSSLRTVRIPESVTSIGNSAFCSCISLESITIPNGMQSIEPETFRGCSRLVYITIPDSVTSIGNYSFSYCRCLLKVFIPRSVTTFGIDSFLCEQPGPTIYCYEGSEADAWAASGGYTTEYLDQIDEDSIRTITLLDGFRIPCGTTTQITAYVFPDTQTITWTSSDEYIITAGWTSGLLTAVSPGTATITATVGAISSSVDVTAYTAPESFDISPAEAWIAAEDGAALAIDNLQPADAEASITWSSENTGYAVVDNNGFVTPVKPGTVRIFADGEGIHRESILHICYPVQSIAFADSAPVVANGEKLQLTANVTTETDNNVYINKLVTFTSSDESILTVDENGFVTGAGIGTATVTAIPKTNSSAAPATIDIAVVCSNHTVVTDEAVSATCGETGLTEGTHCSVCGLVLEQQQKVDALGHDWGEVSYTWAKDNSTVTAKRVCKRDSSHVQSEKVATTYKVTKEPNYSDKGTGVYTSKEFKKTKAFKVQTKKVSIAKLPRTSIKDSTVDKIKDHEYTGKAIKPKVTVKLDGKKLVLDKDYTVTYEDNTDIGKATVIITGKNAYKGRRTKTFLIVPKPVKLISLLPGSKQMTVTWEMGSNIMGYQIEYSTSRKFTDSETIAITINEPYTVSRKITGLKKGRIYNVRIRTFKKDEIKKYYSEWSDVMSVLVPR